MPAEHGNDLTTPSTPGEDSGSSVSVGSHPHKTFISNGERGVYTPSLKPGHRETERRINSCPSLIPPAPDALLLAGAAISVQALTCCPSPVLEAECIGNRGDMLGPLDHAGHSGADQEEAGGSLRKMTVWLEEEARPVWVGSP